MTQQTDVQRLENAALTMTDDQLRLLTLRDTEIARLEECIKDADRTMSKYLDKYNADYETWVAERTELRNRINTLENTPLVSSIVQLERQVAELTKERDRYSGLLDQIKGIVIKYAPKGAVK